MTVYLVDFENVRSAGLKGVESLSEDDKVVIFYSKNADAITFDVHMLLSKSKAEIETYMILRGGRNSLDFQLSTYLGYLVMENRYRNIVIISADKGFLCAINFWDENKELCNVHIKMSKSIEAFESNTPDDDLENSDGEEKFIQKLSIIPPKSEVKETIRLNAQGFDRRREVETGKTEIKGQAADINTDKDKLIVELAKQESEHDRTKSVRRTKSLLAGRLHAEQERKKRSETVKVPLLQDAKTAWVKKSYNKQVSDPEEKNVRIREKQYPSEITVRKKNPPQPQNPTSKNKIFASEVKLNIVEDVEEIVGDKYGVQYVPMLVELIGKSTGKQHLYRMLVSRLGQDVGKDIYMMIKGQYANLKRK